MFMVLNISKRYESEIFEKSVLLKIGWPLYSSPKIIQAIDKISNVPVMMPLL